MGRIKVFKSIDMPQFVDTRGSIIRLEEILETKKTIKGVLVIYSRAGAVRANHYHKKDSHYAYLVSGKMVYTELPVGDDSSKKEKITVEPGDMIYTPSMTIHAMEFSEPSIFLAFTAKLRNQDMYEEDTIQVKLV